MHHLPHISLDRDDLPNYYYYYHHHLHYHFPMHGFYNYIPKSHYVPRVYSVAAILL